MKNTDSENNIGNELIALYQVTVEDIRFFKSQQWTLTNYISIGFAALVAVTQIGIVDEKNPCSLMFLIFAAIIAYVIGLLVLCELKNSIVEKHERLRRAYDAISSKSEAFKTAKGDTGMKPVKTMTTYLSLILTIGLFIVLWILLT